MSFLEACTPGYYNNEGSPRAGSAFFGAYTPGINAFNRLLEEWRDQGDMVGLGTQGGRSSDRRRGSKPRGTSPWSRHGGWRQFEVSVRAQGCE